MIWPWKQQRGDPSDKSETRQPKLKKLHDAPVVIQELAAKALSLPTDILVLSAFLAGSATTACSIAVCRRYWRRLPTAEWITPDILSKGRWIKGYVTRSALRPCTP